MCWFTELQADVMITVQGLHEQVRIWSVGARCWSDIFCDWLRIL